MVFFKKYGMNKTQYIRESDIFFNILRAHPTPKICARTEKLLYRHCDL